MDAATSAGNAGSSWVYTVAPRRGSSGGTIRQHSHSSLTTTTRPSGSTGLASGLGRAVRHDEELHDLVVDRVRVLEVQEVAGTRRRSRRVTLSGDVLAAALGDLDADAAVVGAVQVQRRLGRACCAAACTSASAGSTEPPPSVAR